MTRDKCRDLDKLAMIYLTALGRRDGATLRLLWAAAEYDDDLADMLYGLAAESDRAAPFDFPGSCGIVE